MAYSLKRSDRTIGDGIRRIALSQIASGLDELDSHDLATGARVHQVRKRCKKLRGLVRLVRSGFDGYADENAVFRDAARLLSDVRDARSLAETCDDMAARHSGQLKVAATRPVLTQLQDRADREEAAVTVKDALDEMRRTFVTARARVRGWKIEVDPDMLRDGVEKTYGRARHAMRAATDAPSSDALHEWRKRVKYHWYHMRLLKRAGGAAIPAQRNMADDLSERLGDHHDLHVFRTRLADLNVDADSRDLLSALAARRQDKHRRAAFRLGQIALIESKSAHVGRIGGYVDLWRGTSG